MCRRMHAADGPLERAPLIRVNKITSLNSYCGHGEGAEEPLPDVLLFYDSYVVTAATSPDFQNEKPHHWWPHLGNWVR